MTTSQRWIREGACLAAIWFAHVAEAEAQAETADPSSVEAQLQALTERVAEQERENARQRAELDQYELRAQLAEVPTASAEDAELAALIEPIDEVADEPMIKLYGFADAGLQRIWGGVFDTGLAQSDALNFVLGNVNIYFDANPLEHFRMLTEVRFTTLPNGAESADLVNGNFTRENTAIFDHTSAAGGFFTIHWGSIVLERAQIEWNPLDQINVRVGYFLTPYGIWNIDHGSPTRIMLRQPLFVSAYVVPERQTGVEIHGTFHLLPWALGYSVYVSNGRMFGGVDFTDDKAVGLRLLLKSRRPFPVQLGGSIYYGTGQDYVKMAGVDAMGQAALLRRETISLREFIGTVDLSLDFDALRIRAEWVARRLEYEPGKRELTLGVQNANSLQSSGYVMFAYLLPWLGLEPLVMAEYLRQPTIQLGEVVITGSAGLNIYFNSALTFRFQYCYTQIVDFEESSVDHSNYNLHILASRLIIAY